MFNSKILLSNIFLFSVFLLNAQNCEFTIRGNVIDEGSDTPLPYVTIFVQELSKGTVTDDAGNFSIENICVGEYHLTFSHIGCESKRIHLDVYGDTSIVIGLPHTSTSIHTVVIEGVKDEYNKAPTLAINRQNIEDNTNRNLAGVLENEAGVHFIKNGGGISKPVVHGLYGNRLIILNNGIIQSGQQWGNDHSPEIDPFAADKIVVLKGANALEYGAGNLGSVILVEPKRIAREPHLHGQVNYFYETNGRGHGSNARLEKYSPTLSWRLNGTIKKYGDKSAADYFLNNTGSQEVNLALQLEKSYADKLFLELYASTFNSTLGVLRGSHIGNLTDLEDALSRDIPAFTELDFSYDIEAPKQEVSHHLIKARAKYYLSESKSFEFVAANQINNRKEFDIRRGDRSEIPALSLLQYATTVDLKYSDEISDHLTLKVGSQNTITDNTNNPETEILPLIPDYISWKSGIFGTLSKSQDRAQYNLGLRYDYEFQNVYSISSGVPPEVIQSENQFHNISGLFAINVDLSKTQTVSLNTGFAMRNPAINELYSKGLHQGVSGIEEGDPNLATEKAIKNTVEYKWFPNANFSFSTLAYYQHFTDYIFLNPQDEFRLTIRGAFPVFRYEQSDATIFGFDLSSQFTLGNAVLGNLNYSYLRGENTTSNIPLVFMPSNSLFGSIVYRVQNTINLSESLLMEEFEFELNNRLVFEQKNLLPEQDFVAPPPTYNLVGCKLSTNVLFSTYKLRFYVKAENLFNVQYRDYLNRQRYFSDDIGFSLTTGINFKF